MFTSQKLVLFHTQTPNWDTFANHESVFTYRTISELSKLRQCNKNNFKYILIKQRNILNWTTIYVKQIMHAVDIGGRVPTLGVSTFSNALELLTGNARELENWPTQTEAAPFIIVYASTAFSSRNLALSCWYEPQVILVVFIYTYLRRIYALFMPLVIL